MLTGLSGLSGLSAVAGGGSTAVARTGRFFLDLFGSAVNWGEGLCCVADNSGNVYLAGTADFGNFDPTQGFTAGSDFRWYIVRLTSGLAVDPTFGAGGIVTLDWGNNDAELTSLTLDSNGKLVASGIDWNQTTPARAIHLARFNTD